jgi:hypothetical protein
MQTTTENTQQQSEPAPFARLSRFLDMFDEALGIESKSQTRDQ